MGRSKWVSEWLMITNLSETFLKKPLKSNWALLYRYRAARAAKNAKWETTTEVSNKQKNWEIWVKQFPVQSVPRIQHELWTNESILTFYAPGNITFCAVICVSKYVVLFLFCSLESTKHLYTLIQNTEQNLRTTPSFQILGFWYLRASTTWHGFCFPKMSTTDNKMRGCATFGEVVWISQLATRPVTDWRTQGRTRHGNNRA